MNYVDFFSDLGFDFKNDLRPNSIKIEKNFALSEKLKDSVFHYKNPNNTNTSFYLITITLSELEIEELRKFIWNRSDADLLFIFDNINDKFNLFYAKYSPKVSNKESFWESFSASQADLEKIVKIKHWQFDSGVFWSNYYTFINTSKYKGIAKELFFMLPSKICCA